MCFYSYNKKEKVSITSNDPCVFSLRPCVVTLVPVSDPEGEGKLTSRVSKFSADWGFLIRASSFAKRLSCLLSAPGMIPQARVLLK